MRTKISYNIALYIRTFCLFVCCFCTDRRAFHKKEIFMWNRRISFLPLCHAVQRVTSPRCEKSWWNCKKSCWSITHCQFFPFFEACISLWRETLVPDMFSYRRHVLYDYGKITFIIRFSLFWWRNCVNDCVTWNLCLRYLRVSWSKFYSYKDIHILKIETKWIVITIFKGGSKRKDDPGSYNAITLTSSLLKLYERLLYTRLVNSMSHPLNPLQGGFQKNMGCTMTSFLLQESVNYAMENNSKLDVCFLDAKQAFDYVWHAGLFLKLHELGIDLYLWKTIVILYENLTGYVKFRGFKSPEFEIFQGTWQGGVTSPLMFLCLVDYLLSMLCDSGFGHTRN